MTDGPNPIESPAPPSPRPVRRRATFVILAGVLAIVGALAAGYYFAMRPVTLRIAVGPGNSDDLRVVQALAQALNNQQHGQVRLRPVPTDGASASATLLGEGKADLAIIRGDLEVPKNAQAVATLRKNVAVLWVPPAVKVRGKKAAPKITKIAQLAGHRIGVVGRTPANVNLLKLILQQYGVDPAKVEDRPVPGQRGRGRHPQPEGRCLSRGGSGQQQDHLRTRSLRRPTTAARRSFWRSIRRRRLRRTIRPMKLPKFPPGRLAARRASPKRKSRRSVSRTTSWPAKACRKRPLPPTRQLFAIRQSLKNEFPLAAKIETPDTDKDATIPVHPGAAAFVDGEEKTFLDRYSDFIWWGLMALSAMGSAGAWFAGYLKKDERNGNTSQRERLLEMLTTARHRDSADELDQMQAEADDILRDTLRCFEHGAIEEGALTAFNIALEQFHNAVADRKALLTSIPHNLQRASAQFRAAGTA